MLVHLEGDLIMYFLNGFYKAVESNQIKQLIKYHHNLYSWTMRIHHLFPVISGKIKFQNFILDTFHKT